MRRGKATLLILACSGAFAAGTLCGYARHAQIRQDPMTQEVVRLAPAVPIRDSKQIDAIMRTNPKLSRNEAVKMWRAIQSNVREVSEMCGCDIPISPELFLKLVMTESRCNPNAKGIAGEIGLAQVLPKWHEKELKQVGIITNRRELWKADTNIRAGVYILTSYAKQSRNVSEALARYNAGNNTRAGMAYAERVQRNQI